MHPFSPHLRALATWNGFGSRQERDVQCMLLDGSQVTAAAAIMNVDLHARIAVRISVKKCAKETAGQRRQNANMNHAGFRTTSRRGRSLSNLKLFIGGEHLGKKPLTRRRESRARAVSHEKRNAKFIFQSANCSTHTGLPDIQGARCVSKTPPVGRDDEAAQMCVLNCHLICWLQLEKYQTA